MHTHTHWNNSWLGEKLRTVCGIHSNSTWTRRARNGFSYTLNCPHSGYSAKYSVALTAAAINFNLVWITVATTDTWVLVCWCMCTSVRARQSSIKGKPCRFIWFISAAVYNIRQPVITSVLHSVCSPCMSPCFKVYLTINVVLYNVSQPTRKTLQHLNG